MFDKLSTIRKLIFAAAYPLCLLGILESSVVHAISSSDEMFNDLSITGRLVIDRSMTMFGSPVARQLVEHPERGYLQPNCRMYQTNLQLNHQCFLDSLRAFVPHNSFWTV